MYKGKIFKKKEGHVIVFLRPERVVFIPVKGELRSNIIDGDTVEFDIDSAKIGTARVTRYLTQRQEDPKEEAIEILREHMIRMRQDKEDHIRNQSYAKAAACREIEKELERVYYKFKEESEDKTNKTTSNTWNPSDGPESAEEL